jgi:signal transduction histidine kinase/CheY-like chemotaxis protein
MANVVRQYTRGILGTLATFLSRRPLWYQLALLALAAAVPLLFSTYFMFNRLVENDHENIRLNLLLNSKTLAALVDKEIDTHLAIASTLTQSPALASGDLQSFSTEARLALRFVPGSWLAVRSPTGEMLLTTLEPYSTLKAGTRPRVEPLIGFNNPNARVSDLALDSVSQKLRAVAEVPVYVKGELRYVVSMSLVPERFLALFKDQYVNGEVVGVLDRHYKFVARVPAHDTRVGTLAGATWRAAILKAPEGITENVTLEGDLSLTGYSQTRNGWTVGVARLEKDIQSPLRNILLSTLAVSLSLAGLSFLLVLLLARNVSAGIRDLTQAAEAIGAGKTLASFPTPFAEATTLANTMHSASKELERRGHALEEANSELEQKVQARTAELKAELVRREEAEATLRQAQKIETIGQLTGGIAHDFNNMLTVIMGNLDTVQRRMRTMENAATLMRPIESAQQGARNAAKLTHRLLAFARQQPLEPEVIALNSLITGMSDLMSRTVGEQVKIETVLSAGLWSTFADANQLENALANLIVNARDAMPSGGKLTIETSNIYFDDAYVGRFGDVKPGYYVMLSVSDAGTGIEKDKLERIFEPFYTTKAMGKGTGLGLAMVYGFVKQSGGHIRLYSEMGQGTTVKIYLPRHTDSVAIASAPRTIPPAEITHSPRAKKGDIVLLVEDDYGVREYAISVLEDLGYKVIATAEGREALTVVESKAKIDLLFTDVVLGGEFNGRQLADAVKQIRPTLPVLFTTGYTRNAIVHQGRLDVGVNLLNKPYTQLDLARKIRAAIDDTLA